jgi:hypothetical protein
METAFKRMRRGAASGDGRVNVRVCIPGLAGVDVGLTGWGIQSLVSVS